MKDQESSTLPLNVRYDEEVKVRYEDEEVTVTYLGRDELRVRTKVCNRNVIICPFSGKNPTLGSHCRRRGDLSVEFNMVSSHKTPPYKTRRVYRFGCIS